MRRSLFIADTHLFHGEGITRFRPQFKTMKEHDEFIIKKLNEHVNPTDTLTILGDVAIREGGWELLGQLHCRSVIVVPGNHCGERAEIDTTHVKRIMGAYSRRLPHGRLEAVFTHIPVHPDCLDRWQVNVHGHLHDRTIDDPRYLCVSCEAVDYVPISTEDIFYQFKLRWMEGKLDLPEYLFDKHIPDPGLETPQHCG